MKKSVKNFLRDNWTLLLRCAGYLALLLIASYGVFCVARAVKFM